MENNCLTALRIKEVKKTVEVLLKAYEKQENKDLISDTNVVRIQFSFKKVPKLGSKKSFLLRLPHSVRKPNEEICLFVKDLDRNSREFEVTEDHFKELLETKGVTCISQIIPLKALKLEYKPYEAKRNLSNNYDLFLADERIIRLLPSQLGRNFYARKRDPVQVNLQARNLKKEIDQAVNSSRCVITGRGASNATTVGHTGMTAEDLTENIMEAVNILASKSPGGAANIRNMLLRTGGGTVSLPLYVSFDSGKDVELPVEKKPGLDVEMDEISTLPRGKVIVTSEGDIEVIHSDDDVEEVLKVMEENKGKLSKGKRYERKRKPEKKEEIGDKTREKVVKTDIKGEITKKKGEITDEEDEHVNTEIKGEKIGNKKVDSKQGKYKQKKMMKRTKKPAK